MKNIGRNSLRLGAVNFVDKQDELFWPGDSFAPAILPLKPTTPSTALNVVNYFVSQAAGVSASISANIAAKTGNLIVIQAAYEDNNNSTAWTITNTGSAITWTKKVETNVAGNCKVVVWTGIAGAIPPQSVTVTSTAGAVITGAKVLNVDVAQNAGTDIVNIFSGASATDVSQAVTPTTSNSAVRLFAADWAATNSFTAGNANTLLTQTTNFAGAFSVAALRTIPDPLTSNAAVTISELDTAGTIAWAAFEIPLATVAGNTGTVSSRLVNDNSSLTGVQSASGSIVSRLTADRSSLTGLQTLTGSISSLLVNDLSSLTGTQTSTVTGTIVSRLVDDNSSLTGVQTATGTISSKLKDDLSSLVGAQTSTGSIVSKLKDDLSSLVGTQSGAVSGAIASRLVDDRSSLTGVQTATGSILSLLKADSSSVVGSQSGAVSGAVSSKLVDDRSTLTGVQAATGTITSRLNNDLSSLIGVQSSPVTGFISSILNDDSSVVIGTSGVQPITVVKLKGAGKKSGKKALTYAERKKIDEQVFDALYGLTEELAEKADISKDFITKEFIDEIVNTKVDNSSIDDFYIPSTVIDQSFYEETAKIKTELILKKLQKAQEDDDIESLLLLL